MLLFAPVLVATVIALLFKDSLQELGTLGYLGVFLVNVVGSGTFILPLPGIAIVVVGAVAWNPILVALAGATGATVGELAGYLAGAGSRSRFVERNRWYPRIKEWVEQHGSVTIFLFAMIPNPLFDIVGFASGSLGYPVRRFIAACWFGKTVKYLAVVLACLWGSTTFAKFV